MKTTKQSFLLWGAKGHAKVLDEIIRLNGGQVIAIVDSNPHLNSPIKGLTVLDGLSSYKNWLSKIKDKNIPLNISAVAAIGGSKGKDRIDFLQMFQEDGFDTPSVIHPKSHICDTAKIGDNTHVCAFAFIGADTSIGNACIINTKASVDHESILGNGVHLAPGVTLCGCVTLGNNVFVGSGAIVLPNLSIGENSTIGAGSVVTRDIPENVLVYGNPAKIIRNLKNA